MEPSALTVTPSSFDETVNLGEFMKVRVRFVKDEFSPYRVIAPCYTGSYDDPLYAFMDAKKRGATDSALRTDLQELYKAGTLSDNEHDRILNII